MKELRNLTVLVVSGSHLTVLVVSGSHDAVGLSLTCRVCLAANNANTMTCIHVFETEQLQIGN